MQRCEHGRPIGWACSDCAQKETKKAQSASVRGYLANQPREYELDKPEELQRLYCELAGYMRTCRNCGGDFEGRQFAREALDKLREAI